MGCYGRTHKTSNDGVASNGNATEEIWNLRKMFYILCIVNFKTTFLRNWGEPCCSIKKHLGSVTCHACMLNLIIESMHWFMYYATCALLKVTFRQMGLCFICNYFHSCDNECIHTHFLSMCLYNFMYIHVHVLII